YSISKNSLQIIDENQKSIKKAIEDLITELLYYYWRIAYKKSKASNIHLKTPVNIYLKSLARNIVLKSYDNNELRKILKTDLNSLNEYKINKNYFLKAKDYTKIKLKDNLKNMEVYVNEIYSDFIHFFEPLEKQGNVTQSELDLAIENFHCESKLKIFNVFFRNVKKENFIDCVNPLKLSNNTTSYIPYNHTEARELFFDLDPIVYQTKNDRLINGKNYIANIAIVIASIFILYSIYCLYKFRRR
ncbi:hypothetical protein TUBRATIS_13110, partial [Tubulinosema ratisbonensis]